MSESQMENRTNKSVDNTSFDDLYYSQGKTYTMPTMSIRPHVVEQVRRNAFIEAQNYNELGMPVSACNTCIKCVLIFILCCIITAILVKILIILKVITYFISPILDVLTFVVDSTVQMITPSFI
ncbi:MAG: hypothetical protein MHPSP_002592, partial [Paramarteilia canceri]